MTTFSKFNFDGFKNKTFSTKIPSTGQEVLGTYYTLDDEITLAGFYQLDDTRFFYAALANFIQDKYSLTPDVMDKLTAVDIQHLQLELKKNSDGPKLNIVFKCPGENCDAELKAEINLEKVYVKNIENFTKILDIDEVTKMEVGLPFYKEYFDVVNEFKDLKDNDFQKVLSTNINLFRASIKSIIQGDVVTKVDMDMKNEEGFENFFKTNLRTQYKEFIKYIEDGAPNLVYDEKIVCAKCDKKIKLGIDDFFYFAL